MLLPSPASIAGAVTAAGPVDQRYLFEARQMQALSLAVHIPLVCFGIAFPALVLFAEWRYLRTGDPLYRTLARRWSKIMLALFAVGVVTGTILPIALAGITGSMFVIAVNAWMNHPTGFRLSGGRAVDAHPWSALFANPFFWSEYVHMYFAGYIVCGFLMAGAYAWAFLRGRRGRYERTALGISLSAAAVASPLQVVVGDWAARDVAQAQPVKLAAMEGLAVTTRGAAEHLLGWYNGHAVVYGIEIPRLLSLLAFHNPNATVKGLDIVPLAGQPPVNVVRFAFQAMVGIGTLLALLGLVYLYLRLRRGQPPTARWFCWAIVLAGPLSVVALIAGWITTEVGRQPWIVYDVMRVGQAVTGAHVIPFGYAALWVVYLGLGVAVGWLLRRFSQVPLEGDHAG